MVDASKILVFDLECTCWMGHPPIGMRQEIIEIGACLFDSETNEILNKKSIIIKPQASVISEFCQKLTSISQEMVDQGVSFSEACDMLKDEYGSATVVSAAWGRSDMSYMLSDCDHKGLKSPFSGTHWNIQKRFAKFMNSRNEVSVANALKAIGLEFDGRQHRAVDDAYNSAVVMKHMLKGSK